MCYKAFILLGFILSNIPRISSYFPILTALCCFLVRSIIDYGSVIWDPFTSSHTIMIERVRRAKLFRQIALTLYISNVFIMITLRSTGTIP